jgi:NAD-dependent DNA ligase
MDITHLGERTAAELSSEISSKMRRHLFPLSDDIAKLLFKDKSITNLLEAINASRSTHRSAPLRLRHCHVGATAARLLADALARSTALRLHRSRSCRGGRRG